MSTSAFIPSYSFTPRPAVRAVLGVLAGGLCLAAPAFAGSAAHAALWPAAVLVALAWSACDARARILPLELSCIFAVIGVAWQAACGLEALAWAAGCAAVCTGILAGLGKIYSLAGKPRSVGGGDIRLIFPVALAAGADGLLPGIIAAMVLCIAYMAARRIATGEKLRRDTALPMGPMLAAWALAGMAVSAWAAGAVM